jgi:hypothetical protein
MWCTRLLQAGLWRPSNDSIITYVVEEMPQPNWRRTSVKLHLLWGNFDYVTFSLVLNVLTVVNTLGSWVDFNHLTRQYWSRVNWYITHQSSADCWECVGPLWSAPHSGTRNRSNPGCQDGPWIRSESSEVFCHFAAAEILHLGLFLEFYFERNNYLLFGTINSLLLEARVQYYVSYFVLN